MKILVLNGPNLNALGFREPDTYGYMTLDELDRSVENYAKEFVDLTRSNADTIELEFYQSNHEGQIIDKLYDAMKDCAGVVYNPAAHTHYSYALRDAIASLPIPVVEVHLSNIGAREEFRRHSVMKEVCIGQFMGEGVVSYHKALAFLIEYLEEHQRLIAKNSSN